MLIPVVSHTLLIGRLLMAVVATGLCSCSSPIIGGPMTVVEPHPGDPAPRTGDEISVCGQLFHTGTRVVLWNDAGGYDAYRLHRHFAPEETAPSHAPDRTARYGSYRGGLPEGMKERVQRAGWRPEDLREVVSQVVLHYDQCGTSQRCFEVLHDVRGLSCHFLVDLDGTIYQTLDLKERAWHAAHANDRSIGIEIANIGCYPDPRHEVLSRWYVEDGKGPRVTYPEDFDRIGLPDSFVARPARSALIRGQIHGVEYYQYDLTEEQYVALEQLLTALCRIFPRVSPQMPQTPDGDFHLAVLPDEEMLSFEGFLGHFHLSKQKRDPGPAFDWNRVLITVQKNLEE